MNNDLQTRKGRIGQICVERQNREYLDESNCFLTSRFQISFEYFERKNASSKGMNYATLKSSHSAISRTKDAPKV